MKIYLAGNVPKGADEERDFRNWRLAYKEILEKIFDAEFLLPNAGDIDENDFLLIVGKDSSSIKSSDLVIVNAEEKLGAGTAMEMVIAKYFKKPVITVMPKNSHHRRTNVLFQGKYLVEDWMHPFIHTFSDFIVDSVDDIGNIKSELSGAAIKDISIIDKAIAHRRTKHP
ncbi:MAG: hypothetical protein AAB410_03310 [Patescibacteria group bacterium]